MSDAETRIEEALAYIDRAVWASGAEAVGRLHSILQPPPKYRTFGGVRFVETGEFRHAVTGEWWVSNGRSENLYLAGGVTVGEYRILAYAPEPPKGDMWTEDRS